MSKLKLLRSFLISKNLIRHASLVRKIAIDIKEEDILESIREATEERDHLELFDYSDLFEDGKNYVILPKDEDGSLEGVDLSTIYEEARLMHSEIGMSVDFQDYISDPTIIKIFGETFSLNDNLNSVATKIYTAAVLPRIRKIFKDKFPLFVDMFKTEPISYLQSQDISTAFELERDIVDSSLFLNMPSEVIERVNNEQGGADFEFNEQELMEQHRICKYDISRISRSIGVLSNLSNKIFSLNSNSSSINLGSYKSIIQKFKIVISYDPNDIATATYSTSCGTNWWSCKDIKQSKDILRDVVEGGMVAYLVGRENPYPVQNPFARVRIRHYGTSSRDSYDNKDFVLIPEKRVYGRGISEYEEMFFLKVVEKWVSEANDIIKNSSSEYHLRGDDYTDTLSHVTGPISSKMYNLDIQGNVFRLNDARRMVQRGELIRDEGDPNLTIQLAVGLTGLNFEESAIDELTKDLSKREMEDLFSISEDNIDPEHVGLGLLTKLLQTPGGRNLQFKSVDKEQSLTKEDLSKFIKSFKNFFKIIFSKNIYSAIGDDGVDKAFEIVSSVFLKFDEITKGEKIHKLFSSLYEKHSFIDEEIRKVISPILSNVSGEDIELLEERITAAAALRMHLSAPIIPEYRKKLLKIISEISKEDFSNIGYSIIEYLSKIFEEMFNDKEVANLFQEEIDEYIKIKGNTYFIESYLSEDYESLFSSISKILKSDIENINKEELRIILDIAKRGMYDDGFIDVRTMDEAEEYLSSVTGIEKENISNYYNLINIDEYGYNLKRWFHLHEKKYGFRFKKKIDMGGLIPKYSIQQKGSYYSQEEALLASRHYGLSKDSVRQNSWNKRTYQLIIPV